MTPIGERLRDPILWTDISQLAKTVAAAVIAWVLAADAFALEQPFLAPWAALLTVHATVYRTFARGAQQVGAAVLGVVLAFAAGTTLGVNALSLGLMLAVAMAAGAFRALRAESTTAAATALVVLLTGSSGDSGMLSSRLLDTLIGIAVGLLVNLVVWPPLRDRSAARRIDRIDDRLGELLRAMAARMREGGEEDDEDEWVQRTRDIEHDIDEAWAMVRSARESGRLNPRRSAAERIGAAEGFSALLSRLEQAVAETRSLARTLGGSTGSIQAWDADFRATWVDLLARTGAAIGEADADALRQLQDDVAATSRALPADTAARSEEGALLVNLRNIADAMGAVADAQPVRIVHPPSRPPRAMPGA